ncbi:MAG TPA: hypothetical protein VL049_28680 [Candidatus Dormibacteraeota bacterium]|nr:hypothetical protein [Candidatus Dormibacteraeota bacterium]
MRVVRAAGWGVLALALVAAATPQLPLRPSFLEASLDGSFAAVLYHAAAQPAAARPRLISTYGPLGFTSYTVYLPETYARLFIARAALAAVLCWALAWVGWAAWASPWGATVVLLGSAPLLGNADVRGFLLLALLPLVDLVPARPPPTALRIALGAALGVLAVSKVTFVTGALVTLGPLAVAALLARRPPWAALATLVTIVACWRLLGDGWADWVAYLDWSLRDITPGYSQAMQLRTTAALVWHAVAVSAALLAWAAVLAWRRRRSGWWALPIAVAGVLLLQFKAGFVRADVHVFVTAFALLLEGVLLGALLGPRPLAVALAALLVAALPGALTWHALVANGTPTTVFRFVPPREIVERLAMLPTLARGEPFAPPHAQHVRDLRGMMAMPAFDGGVDMIGHWQSLLLANQSAYRPRPVFQGYMAYTPRLARENAAFLASDAGPRWLLFDPETIDGRLPAIDDAASWPVLLSRYQPAGEVGRYALLERRATPRPWRLVPLGGADALTDKPIAVPPPAGGPIWARIDVDQTFAERVTTQLFAAPYEYLDIVNATNAVWRARLVPAIAGDGFLLSPVISTVAGFVALSAEGPRALPAQTVREIRVHVDSPFGKPTAPRAVRVEFARLEIE